mgnify:CR=1 FL=1
MGRTDNEGGSDLPAPSAFRLTETVRDGLPVLVMLPVADYETLRRKAENGTA